MAEEGERFEIERIVDKRYRNDRMEYLIKWRGYPDSQNTWEPSSHIEPEQEAELLAEFEAYQQKLARQQQQQQQSNVSQSPNKRRTDDLINAGMKKRPMSNTPSGFDRGYEPEKVLGATDSAGELMLLVKWRNSDEADLVPARIANQRCPQLVIDFYEQHSFWVKLPKINQNSTGSTIRNH